MRNGNMTPATAQWPLARVKLMLVIVTSAGKATNAGTARGGIFRLLVALEAHALHVLARQIVAP